MTVKLLFPIPHRLDDSEARHDVPFWQIDYHAHVFLRSLPMDDRRRYSPAADAPLSVYRALLERHGLTGSVLVQPSFLGIDNSFLLNALVQARGWGDGPRLWGVVVVPPDTPRGVLDSMKSAGVVGVRLNLLGSLRPDFTTKPWVAFFDRVNSLGWHVELQVEGQRLAGILPMLLERCERVVVDHFGLPDPDSPMSCPGFQALAQAASDGLWVKATAPRRVFRGLDHDAAALRCAELFRVLRESLGDEALLWGSDWPWTQYAEGQTFSDTVDCHGSWRGHEFDEGRIATAPARTLGETSPPGAQARPPA